MSKIVLVTGDGAATTTGEQWIQNRLTGQGHTVTLREDNTVPDHNADADPNTGHDLIMLSATCSSSTADAYTESLLPIISLLNWLIPGLGYSAEGGSSGRTDMEITDNNHPVLDGLPLGTVTMYSSTGDMGYGKTPIGGTGLAQLPSDPTRITVIVIEPGETRVGTVTTAAPALRIHLPWEPESAGGVLNANGELMFDNAVNYATVVPVYKPVRVRKAGLWTPSTQVIRKAGAWS